jgi:hypothetical protein
VEATTKVEPCITTLHHLIVLVGRLFQIVELSLQVSFTSSTNTAGIGLGLSRIVFIDFPVLLSLKINGNLLAKIRSPFSIEFPWLKALSQAQSGEE